MFRKILFTGILFSMAQGLAFAQKLPISSCTSTTPVSGHGCTLAYDGNTGTDFEGRTTPFTNPILLTLDLGAIRGVKRISITWGTNVPTGGIQVNFKTNVSDPFTDIQGVNPSGPTTVITLPWYNATDTARWVQIATYPAVGAMDIKEIAVYGNGVYQDEEILSTTYTLPASDGSGLNILGGTYNTGITLSQQTASRLVGISTVIYADDGSVHPLERMAGYPSPFATARNYPTGGCLQVQKVNGIWTLILQTGGKSFFASPNAPFFTRLTGTRGYITIYYLSHDPNFF